MDRCACSHTHTDNTDLSGELFSDDDGETEVLREDRLENPADNFSWSARVTANGAPIAGSGIGFIFHVFNVLMMEGWGWG